MTALHDIADRPLIERDWLAAEVTRLTADYERTLTSAIGESDEGRAARAFDATDRLQNQIILTGQRLRRLATAAS